MKTGVLLVNLGTPASPEVPDVRRYLAEFLSDPLVIDVPWVLRMMIVYGFILPFRPKQSAEAYQQIWTEDGSPLLVNTQKFSDSLQKALGDDFCVVLGMRYGQPSLSQAAKRLMHCERLIVLPLFPQYSEAATGSALKKARELLLSFQGNIKIIDYFYQQPAYQQAMIDWIKSHWQSSHAEYLLFSYHGLPERQLAKSGCDKTQCDRVRSCLVQQPQLSRCYRAQCFATTEAIASGMALSDSEYQTAFQSRLGKAQWIVPYTDQVIESLYQRGIRRLMVVCPSFVADCLETLEEIGLRLKEQWLAMGGESLVLVPCLNAESVWVKAAVDLII